MSNNQSVFGDDWRDCLEAHYQDVTRRNDSLTEETLVGVLHDVGYTDEELRELKIQATMRAEDLEEDFVPDVGQHAHDHEHAEPGATLHAGVDVPAEATEEADAPPAGADEPFASTDEPADEETDDPDDGPQQMSMF